MTRLSLRSASSIGALAAVPGISGGVDQPLCLQLAGTVSINGYSEGDISTPFGGYKMSGFGGRDNGLEALQQYTETKTIWVTLH